jgi:hypothetical protein
MKRYAYEDDPSDTLRQVGYWFSQVLHRRIGAAPFLSIIARALPQYPAFVVTAAVFMMACAAFALTILFFFPGYLTRDASFVHSYAQEWYLGDWQSPLMTILWRLIDPISPGSGSMFLLIATLYWLSFAIIAGAVARRSTARAVVVLLLALAPPAFMLLPMIWRDILFGVVWLLAAAIIYFATDRTRPLGWAMRALALALVGFGVLLRPNAIIAAPLLVAYIAWPARFEWKRAALLFIPALLACYGLIYGAYYVILGVHRNNPLHQIVVFDLGGITYFTRENQFPVSWSADEEASLITRCYQPAGWDSYWTQDPCHFVMDRLESKSDVIFGTSRLAWSWLRAVAVHPLAYLRHRLTFLSTFLAGANPTLELERLKFVDQVPLARNRYFMAIAALHNALRSTPLFHKGPWLARRLLTRTGFFRPSLEGGLPLLPLFRPSRRSSSAIRSCNCAIRACCAVFCSRSAAMMASSDARSPPPAPALPHESISAASDMESLTHVQSPASRLHQMLLSG